jgi:glycosyltransferase involved in cell wall biosynthesis
MNPRLLVIHVAWGPKTGVLSLITYLARWQAEQEGVVVRTVFFDSDRNYLRMLDDKMRSEGLGGRSFPCLWTPYHRIVLLGDKRLQRYVEEQSIGVGAPRVVVHIHDSHLSATLLPLTVPDGFTLHPVVTFHGVDPAQLNSPNPLKRLFYLYMARRLARSGATCVSVSAVEIPMLAESLGYRPEVFTPIYNGVPRPEGRPQHHRDNSGRFRVGFAGVFDSRKQWWLAGEAVERARALGADCEVVFAGSLGDVKGVVEWVGQRSNFASYLGEVPNAGTCLIPTLDAVVLPSRYEGLPMLLLEAFAAGVPVIATPVGGVPELVDSGSNGFLVEPTAEAIARRIVEMCEDRALYSTLAANAMATFQERFTMEACGRRYLELYTDGPREGAVSVSNGSAREVSHVANG